MSQTPLRFIDLFAGIGGIRLGFESAGAQCVLSCERDRWARKTYEAYFSSDDHPFYGDICDMPLHELPEFDILTGGFPCQPFSLAGVSKKNSLGRAHGFKDETQGTLFFNIARILEEARPTAFLLENVKNLLSHDRGRTWRVIQGTLRELGYVVTSNVLDAATIVPQHRERVFIVGFSSDHCGMSPSADADWSPFWDSVSALMDEKRRALKQRHSAARWPTVGPILLPEAEVEDRYILSEKMWNYLQAYKEKHRKKGNGFGFGLVDAESPYTRTISARYYKDGSEALVSRGPERRPRRLTPRECARLQGFPEAFDRMFAVRKDQPVSDTQAYRQFGNSVCVPVIEAIAEVQVAYLRDRQLFDRIDVIESAVRPSGT